MLLYIYEETPVPGVPKEALTGWQYDGIKACRSGLGAINLIRRGAHLADWLLKQMRVPRLGCYRINDANGFVALLPRMTRMSPMIRSIRLFIRDGLSPCQLGRATPFGAKALAAASS